MLWLQEERKIKDKLAGSWDGQCETERETTGLSDPCC